MTLRRILTAALGLSLLAACDEDATQSRESELEDYAHAHGVDADVEAGESGEVRSVTVNQGAGKVGSNLALPDDFPDDVPVYENLKLHAVTPIPGGGPSLSGIAGGDLGEVARFTLRRWLRTDGWTPRRHRQRQASGHRSLPRAAAI